MHSQYAKLTFALMMISLAQFGVGCDSHDRGAKSLPPATAPAKLSPWRTQKQSTIVAVRDEATDHELAAAIAKARATAAAARTQWSAAKPDDRKRWAVKWAAPISNDSSTDKPAAEARVEHVWVQPLNWTAFRIEGLLASEPTSELACGKRLGELVSFPIEELTDWIHLTTDDFNGPREGGFTVNVLEQRYGKP